MNRVLLAQSLVSVALVCQVPLAVSDTQYYGSAGIGQFSHDDSKLFPSADQSSGWDSTGDSSSTLQLAWGVANPTTRFTFEYYYQSGDLSDLDIDYTKNSLYFSGYWTPNLFVPKLHGILGAGIGGAQQRLQADTNSGKANFKDREAQYKLTAGIEYRLMDSLTIFAAMEKHYTKAFDDYFIDGAKYTWNEGDPTSFLIGISGFYD